MTKEQTRLQRKRANATYALEKVGPIPQRAPMGNRARRLQREGDAWNFFTHDQARSRAYRWGEDGIAGISDDKQHLCFALALWNGKDPILKERLFGLTNSEGNHGEDVKEYYFYLDSTPTHSYMKYLYKYPQAAFPYADLVETNRRRTRERDGVRTARHRRLQRRPLLRRLRGVRQRRRRKTSWCGSRRPTGGRKRPNCISCRRCGSATTGRRGLPNPTGLPRSQPQADRGAGGHERGRGSASAAG